MLQCTLEHTTCPNQGPHCQSHRVTSQASLELGSTLQMQVLAQNYRDYHSQSPDLYTLANMCKCLTLLGTVSLHKLRAYGIGEELSYCSFVSFCGAFGVLRAQVARPNATAKGKP